MKTLVLVACLGLFACAASPQKMDEVARTEAARLVRPSKALSSFAEYELRPITLGSAVQGDAEKVAESAKLQEKLNSKLEPLLAQWRAAPAGTRAGKLVIEPQLAALRIVSSGARFWAGAMAGDSQIDVDLQLTEAGSTGVLAKVRIARGVGGYAGGWSVGKTDQNLHDYIVAIVHQYLVDSY